MVGTAVCNANRHHKEADRMYPLWPVHAGGPGFRVFEATFSPLGLNEAARFTDGGWIYSKYFFILE